MLEMNDRQVSERVRRDMAKLNTRVDLKLSVVPDVEKAVSDFLLDKKSGTVVLHVKDGRILGCFLEQKVSVKA